MADFSVSVDIAQALTKLGNLDRLQDRLEPIAQRRIRAIRDRARTYPSRLPNQRYVRTYTLRGGWTDSVRRVSGGIVAEATNQNVPYNRWVQGHGTQAGIHRGRWETDKQILDAETPVILREFGEELQRICNE